MSVQSTWSELLGWISIACWLGAQFPQILENHRRKSVEGLALPFLMNWLLGDATNLLGCILTHQLPFQTYLATYFCFVDLSLLWQYIYYSSSSPKDPNTSYARHERLGSVAAQRIAADRGIAAPRYRALSNVAANVAAAAALAAQQEEQARWHGRRSHSTEARRMSMDEDDVSEDAMARMGESFYSEGGGRSGRGKHVAWSATRDSRQSTVSPGRRMYASLHMTHHAEHPTPASASAFDSIARGRPLIRPPVADEGEPEWPSPSTGRRSSRASRKGASMIFLGVWALIGIGTLSNGHGASLYEKTGRILKRADMPAPPPAHSDILSAALSEPPLHPDSTTDTNVLVDFGSITDDPPTNPPPRDHPPPEKPSLEHIIGRIFAWACTTLYLTSRLPQIWKNFVRKSVEGLSMYLFVFAFLGNVFYVSSILSSPNLSQPEPAASAFLRESIPYLLGSGGTLMFDVTIVTQSFLYRPKRSRRASRSRTQNEEEAGLLSAGATGTEESAAHSRRPTGSVTRG